MKADSLTEYKLKYPIKGDEGNDISIVKLKSRVKGADMLVLDDHQGQQKQALALIARMFKLSNSEVELLDRFDIEKMAEICEKN